jgi:hypothetical protein
MTVFQAFHDRISTRLPSVKPTWDRYLHPDDGVFSVICTCVNSVNCRVRGSCCAPCVPLRRRSPHPDHAKLPEDQTRSGRRFPRSAVLTDSEQNATVLIMAAMRSGELMMPVMQSFLHHLHLPSARQAFETRRDACLS